MITAGTVLKAKDYHPIYQRGGDGIALVTKGANENDFFTFLWVNGDPGNAGYPSDMIAAEHLDKWFDIIPEAERNIYLPATFSATDIVPEPRRNSIRDIIRQKNRR